MLAPSLRTGYPGLDRETILIARRRSRSYVRGDVQIGPDNERARGRRLSAVEVAVNFGIEALYTLDEEGAMVIQAQSNASSITIRDRLSALNISNSQLAERAEVELEVLEGFIAGSSFIPIRVLERICFHLGLDEGRISATTEQQAGLNVRLRYYDRDEDEHTFSAALAMDVGEKAWKLQKLSYFRALKRQLLANDADAPGFGGRLPSFIDDTYSSPNSKRPTIDNGEALAKRVRSQLEDNFRSERHLKMDHVFQGLGIGAYRDELSSEYSGMTLINAWDNSRAVISNQVGKNSIYEIQRFTLAHELGHALCDPTEAFVEVVAGGAGGATAGRAVRSGRSSKSRDLPELRANVFAINYLVPTREVQSYVAELSTKELYEIIRLVARQFGVSTAAARHRVHHVGLPLAQSSPRLEPTDAIEEIPFLNEALLSEAQSVCELGLIHPDSLEAVRVLLSLSKDQA